MKNLTFIYESYWYAKWYNTRRNQALITKNMWSLIEKSYRNSNLKWHMLSGHDTSVAPMQAALNITNFDCLYQKFKTGYSSELNCKNYPMFSASLIFEFYSDQIDYVKVKNNGEYVYLCEKEQKYCET